MSIQSQSHSADRGTAVQFSRGGSWSQDRRTGVEVIGLLVLGLAGAVGILAVLVWVVGHT